MILKTFDSKEIYITKEQAESISTAISGGAKFLKIGDSYVASGAIATIIPGGTDPSIRSLPAPKKIITDEQRKLNLARLLEMKREFMARREVKA